MGKTSKIGLEKKKAFKVEMKKKRKELRANLKLKRAKLIVSNLPFKSTEENLKEHFNKHGEVESVNILKKDDGKMVGCAFVQFKLVQSAARARHYLNEKDFLGRNLVVDFAKPKNKYKKEKKVKETELVVKEEDVIDLSTLKDKDEVKEEVLDIKTEDESIKSDNDSVKSENDSVKSEETSAESSDEEDIDEKIEEKPDLNKKPHMVSQDVSEGKTIFIKNVPFDATNNDLKQCMLQFGPVFYALICIDKLTEHSKGTAFVKFKNKEDAEKCLEANGTHYLHGNLLDFHSALSRNDINQKTAKKPRSQDSRNLYLVKEGVILAGTKAAEGVSATDMAKRLQLEQYKTQMLRNLNMFVSRTRLIVHNLPATWNDAKFHALLKKHSNDKAIIKEARIMRNLRNVDARGVGKSKEFGFATFATHEDALKVLRSLNNNPNIFSVTKRPIVAFSIENRSIVKGKEKRLMISKHKNPKCKDFNPNLIKKRHEFDEKSKGNKHEDWKGDVEAQEFSGVSAKPGVKKMRSRYNLKVQAKLHYDNMKKEKKKSKNETKSFEERKKDFRKQEKQKVNHKQESDHFSKLVNKYKESLIVAQPAKKSKWYE
ncbi:RNA-binding protein 28 [Onthophagus taurus]|uniref:RNA-binding protein 28 n=1 Tax=Onthophagus taurus TaxID=166361 RepID=UPI0039BDC65E